MDRFERMLTLLRSGQTERAVQLRATAPGACLPLWTAGEPLSPALRQVHQLGSLIDAVHLDDTYAWAMVDHSVYRIPLAGGEEHRLRLEGRHQSHYRDAAFHGDTVVAVAHEQLLVWDLVDGRLLLSTDPDDIPLRAGRLRSLAVGAGTAVTGTDGGYLLQWSLTDGALLARTAAHGGCVTRVAISTDGTPTVLSLGGEDHRPGTLCFHDLDGLHHTGEVALLDATSCGGWTVLDGQRRAVTVANSLLTVWDATTAAPVAGFPTTTHPAGAPAFIAGGAWAVLAESAALRIVDLRDGTVRGTIRTDFTQHVDEIAVCGSFVFAAQGRSTEGRTNLLEFTDPLAQDDTGRPHYLDAVPATIDGQPVVIALDEDGPLETFNAEDGRRLGEPVGERSNKYRTLGGHPRLRALTVGGRDLLVLMSKLAPTTVDPATGETHTAPEPPLSFAVLTAVATDNGLIAAVDARGTLAVWDATTLTLRASARIAANLETTSVALGDLHGRTVVLTGADGGGIRWFDSADLTELAPPGRFAERTGRPGHIVDGMHWPGPDAVTKLDVFGTVVISAVGDTVTCADMATGEASGPALVHPDKVWAILPAVLDGVSVVATSCADRVLRVWEIATGRTTWAVTLPRPVHRIVSVTGDQLIVLDAGCLVAVGLRTSTPSS